MKLSPIERADANAHAQSAMAANMDRVRTENAPSLDRHKVGSIVTIRGTDERKQDATVLAVRESDHYGPSYRLAWRLDGVEHAAWITGQRLKAAKSQKVSGRDGKE